MKLIYVSGPLTDTSPRWLRLLRRLLLLPSGEERNTRNALRYATRLRDAGFAVFVPHLTIYWDRLYPTTYEAWLATDLAIIPRCDAMLRIPGKSNGASREVLHATKLKVPVFFSVESVIAWRSANAAKQPAAAR